MRLGKREVDALTCPEGKPEVLVFDGELPGFGVRVTAKGRKIFILQYRVGARVARLRLGAYGEITPAEARRLAEEARGKVRGGGDPVEERRAAREGQEAARTARKRARAADALTVRVLVDRWQDGALRERSTSYRQEAPRCLRSHLAPVLDTPAAELGRDQAQLLVDGLARRHPTTARRVRAYARSMFGWAGRRNLVGANPFGTLAVDVREVSRDRVLTDEELGRFWRATGAAPFPFGPFFRVLALTMQRRGEVAGMRWDEISADGATWTIPAGRAKNGRAHLVHLAPVARGVLRAIPRQRLRPGVTSPLVFTTNGRNPVSGFSQAFARIARGSVAEDMSERDDDEVPWHLHDLRRTGVTVLARLGTPPHVADRVLNHVSGTISGVAAVYQRHQFLEERRAALERWAAYVVEVGDGREPAANVVALSSSAG